jgi:hypothetical protein
MPAAKKPNKADRINAFLKDGAQRRAVETVKAYLSKTPMGLADLPEEKFHDVMERITKAMLTAYSKAMCDTLDVVNGRDLDKIT